MEMNMRHIVPSTLPSGPQDHAPAMLREGVGCPSQIHSQIAQLKADRKDAGNESHVRILPELESL